MKQNLRRVLLGIKKLDPSIQVEVLRQRKHTVLQLTRGERKKRLAMSVSPKNEHFQLPNVLDDVRKYLMEKNDAAL